MPHEITRRMVLRGTAAGLVSAGEWARPPSSPAVPTRQRGKANTYDVGRLDTLVFGEPSSEAAHGLTPTLTQVIEGELGQSARVLLPDDENNDGDGAGVWGGTLIFTAACAPEGVTYVTIKLWGGDHADDESGYSRLQLFCDGLQVGHYHQGAVDPLDIQGPAGQTPGRFFFHTLPLPEHFTEGKEQIELGIRSMGRIWPYGQTPDRFYRDLVEPTRGVYAVYTHTSPHFAPPDGDVVGQPPEPSKRLEPGREVLDAIAQRVRDDHDGWLYRPPAGLDPWAYQGLAEGYLHEGTAAYQNPQAIDQALAAIDAQYLRWQDDPRELTASDQQWEGFGKAGLTLVLLWDVLGDSDDGRLDDVAGGPPTDVPNPGFEGGLAGWNHAVWRGAGSTAADETVARSGTRSARVTADAGYDPPTVVGLTIAQNRFRIGTGPHRYSVWCRTENITGQGAYLDVIFYGPDGEIVQGDRKFYAATGTHDWELISADLETPEGATEVRIDIRVEGSGTAWFDDVSMDLLDGATPPPVPDDLPVRRDAYVHMLRESIDYWRQHLPHYSNQVMICALGLYRCNRALALLAPERALPEEKARDYIYQAVGLRPWLGPEDAEGNPSKILGEHYYQATEKGLTKELGYVGNYGEVTDWLVLLYESVTRARGPEPTIDDPVLRDHLVKMINARALFRYPEVDDDGHRCMRLETATGWRDDKYPGDIVYAQRTAWDGHPLMAAAVFDDPGIVGRTQRLLDDNQLWAHIGLLTEHGWTRVGLNAARLVQRDFAAATSRQRSDVGFPMDWDASDQVFADEENGVVAVKNGEQILYVSLYWRARQALNHLARVHLITPQTSRTATIRQHSSAPSTGEWYTEPDWVCLSYAVNDPEATHIPPGGFAPPGPQLHQAFAGEQLPVGPYPDDVVDPDLGRDFTGVETLFVGRAELYRCEYGRYRVAMNTSATRSHRVRFSGRGKARNVATGDLVPLQRRIELPPRSTVVLYQDA